MMSYESEILATLEDGVPKTAVEIAEIIRPKESFDYPSDWTLWYRSVKSKAGRLSKHGKIRPCEELTEEKKGRWPSIYWELVR